MCPSSASRRLPARARWPGTHGLGTIHCGAACRSAAILTAARRLRCAHHAILLIEDDEKIGGFIAQGLRQEGTSSTGAAMAKKAWASLWMQVGRGIIDLMLPAATG